MWNLKKNKWMPLLMALTILAIAGFQVYWINKTYDREERNLEMRSNMLFRETIRGIQASKLKLDSSISDSGGKQRYIIQRELTEGRFLRKQPREKMIGMMDVIMQKTIDTTGTKIIVSRGDSLRVVKNVISPRQSRIMQFLYDVDSLQDSIRVSEIELAYSKKLAEQKINIPFHISRVSTTENERPSYNEVTLGFANPLTFRLDLGNVFPFLVKRISAAILFSIFLVGFTILSFTLLYRNLQRQRRLADIKNEFISNITHELKTPIATVSVAIEALRSFSASLDPQKTKEYLDISANELQRLSLLVDKVLKLSMFEKKEIELKYEWLNMQQLVEEVTTSMRLQFEKRRADIRVEADGDTNLEGDRLHLVSVLFNLLDNALKYSTDKPVIHIAIKNKNQAIELVITDNGIGIPPEYHHRIFEKFFRVPQGNVHNAKGYGLGLSYVSHVIDKHNGSIKIASGEAGGTCFTISLPVKASA